MVWLYTKIYQNDNKIYDSIDIKDITKDTNIQIIHDNQTKSLEKDYDIFK